PKDRPAGDGAPIGTAAQDAWSRFADRRGADDGPQPTTPPQDRWWGMRWIPVALAALVAIVLIVVAVVWWRSDSTDAAVGPGPQLAVGLAVACWIDDGQVRCADPDGGEHWSVDADARATSVAMSRSQLCISAEDQTVSCRLLVSGERDRPRATSTGL